MALKPAICTQCGGKIEVDDSKEAGICQFCGTAFVTEKVINKYITQNITQNTYTGTVYNIQNGPDSDSLYTLARRAKEVGNYNEAYKYYSELRERNPNDWEAVFYHAIYSKASSQVLEFAFKLLEESSLSDEEKFEGKKEFFSELKKNKENSDFIFNFISKTNLSIQEFIAIYGDIKDSIEFNIKWADIIEKYYNAALEKNNNVINHECMDLFEFLRCYWKKAVPVLEKMVTLSIEDKKNEKGVTVKQRFAKSFVILSDSWLPEYPKMKELEERLAEFEGYIEKATFYDDKKDLYLFMYKEWLSYLGYCLENGFYNRLVKKIKALDPGFIAEVRESSPGKIRKDTVKKVLGVIFEIALPILVITIPWGGDSIFEDHHFLSVLGCVVYYIILICVWVKCDAVGSFNKFMGNAFIVILEIAFPMIALTIFDVKTDYISDNYEKGVKLFSTILAIYYVALIIFWVISGIIKIRRNKGKK